MKNQSLATDAPRSVSTHRSQRLRALLAHRSLSLGLLLLLGVLSFVLLAPLFGLADPEQSNPASTFLAPSGHHPFGTDSFGRDLLSRVAYGGRTTIAASVVIVVLGGIVGTAMGVVAGLYGGPVGFVLMRIVDLLLAFPGILLALAAGAVLGPGLRNGVLAIALVAVPAYARMVEGATLEIRQRPYVDAAIALGASRAWIAWTHVLPNVRSGILVMTTTWTGFAALWIAALGFLGMGVSPPSPEWGVLLSGGQDYISFAWWLTVFPGVFLASYVVAVNLIGDGLRDALDPALSRH
ncbi:ABC transporter permease [Nocardioides carbamazepini]|uniref:ABC transporter permease n=1 Tax=Nocardioides carbamazepini TaxID=2854259 RepID=UPI00214A7FAF|nr:ABC transporter permease [Nocardioides carbamazepini]MCR1782376.1 ABC transporter permease [Nocardioides carbamazepini]